MNKHVLNAALKAHNHLCNNLRTQEAIEKQNFEGILYTFVFIF